MSFVVLRSVSHRPVSLLGHGKSTEESQRGAVDQFKTAKLQSTAAAPVRRQVHSHPPVAIAHRPLTHCITPHLVLLKLETPSFSSMDRSSFRQSSVLSPSKNPTNENQEPASKWAFCAASQGPNVNPTHQTSRHHHRRGLANPSLAVVPLSLPQTRREEGPRLQVLQSLSEPSSSAALRPGTLSHMSESWT